MSIRVEEEPIERLDEHGAISIAFDVERVLEVLLGSAGLGGITLREVPVEKPWRKDYDAAKGEGPTRWPKRFDTSRWGLLAAYDDDMRIGGAVVAPMWSGPTTATLWDLRVRPASRGRGVGTALFEAAERWSEGRGCRSLKVETQNINVPACRFYARMGCELWALDRFAYPEFPGETQFWWGKDIGTVR